MRTSLFVAMLTAGALQTPALAAESNNAPSSVEQPSACVDVEVGGYRALSFDCLSQQMAPTKDHTPKNPALSSEDIAKQASNRLGLFNRSATSNRMGNQFGKSAFPQRPPTM